jgi:hypothetical protein
MVGLRSGGAQDGRDLTAPREGTRTLLATLESKLQGAFDQRHVPSTNGVSIVGG